MRNRLRLYSGLVLFFFVLGHFLNHSLGLISLQAAERGTALFIDPWRTGAGSVLLGGAAVIHVGCAVWSLWVRRSLRLPPWELMQMILGFSAPLLLALHVAATRGLTEISGFESSYAGVLAALWIGDPLQGVIQAIALLVVWGHACLGLHTWLRLQVWYLRLQAVMYALAVALPAVALGGYVAAGNEVLDLAQQTGWTRELMAQNGFESWMGAWAHTVEDWVQLAVILSLASVLAVQGGRTALQRLKRRPRLRYAPGDRSVDLIPGATLLESIRAAGIEHASICGGRGRCSTCRVRIGAGADVLQLPSEQELKVLARHSTSPSVRLACQIRPANDLEVAALVPSDISPKQRSQTTSYQQGQELKAAFLFVDLRGSTKLCEDRLPFDVVFILNQFFSELSAALDETDGHYAQFNGDGLMAIYGLRQGPESGARRAVAGAQAMLRRIESLNERLGSELSEPLRIGVGIHVGDAIVGSMGPPATPIVSGLGDTVNIAARLESLTKEFGVPLVFSEAVAELAGIDPATGTTHTVPVKGRDEPITVHAVADPMAVEVALK